MPTEALMRQAGQLIGRLSQQSFSAKGEIQLDGSIHPFEKWRTYQDGLRNLMRHISPTWGVYIQQGLSDVGFEVPKDWSYHAALIDLSSHLEFLTSDRSDAFKAQCVDRIQALLDLSSN